MNIGEECGTHRLNVCYGSVTTTAADIRQVGTLTVYRVFVSLSYILFQTRLRVYINIQRSKFYY